MNLKNKILISGVTIIFSCLFFVALYIPVFANTNKTTYYSEEIVSMTANCMPQPSRYFLYDGQGGLLAILSGWVTGDISDMSTINSWFTNKPIGDFQISELCFNGESYSSYISIIERPITPKITATSSLILISNAVMSSSVEFSKYSIQNLWGFFIILGILTWLIAIIFKWVIGLLKK